MAHEWSGTGISLKALRHDKGWSQAELAQISDLSVRTIQRLEQGRPASLEAVKALAAAFGTSAQAIQARLGPRGPETRQPAQGHAFAALAWHLAGYLATLIALVALVWRFDADPRIATGLGMLGAAALFLHLAAHLHYSPRRRSRGR
ncbi:helix-turn-helix transcriptional regulator [Maricaulis sp.]|uniref:helix-turn-helix domain-containing protein n=1 Tax=Maricaulis sp. TaxID=1486257 RepID=UPI0025BEF429|nr:helix-turn-helix transcriptional regulator [Maricaulis sp.]